MSQELKDICLQMKDIFPKYAELKQQKLREMAFTCSDQMLTELRIEFKLLNKILNEIKNAGEDYE